MTHTAAAVKHFSPSGTSLREANPSLAVGLHNHASPAGSQLLATS